MSFCVWILHKIDCILPHGIRRQAIRNSHLLCYSIIVTLIFILYQWPQTGDFTQLNEDSCGVKCLQRVSERDIITGAKVTEVTRLNVTIQVNLSMTDERRLEPKNWNGAGYQAVPTNRGSLRHCKRCALVTSSGHLSGKGAGKQIDQLECVIRMNAAPTLNYEQDVGSRTTFRVVGHRNFPRMFDTEEERNLYFVNNTTKSEAIVVLWLYSVNVNRNLELILARKFAQKYKNITFYMTKQHIMNRNVELFYQELGISRNKGRLWMSTGWVAMLLALEVCDSTDVYGMIYEDYCKEHPADSTYYHYFDTLQKECNYYERSEKRINSGHKFMTEKVAFSRWASMYNIKFHLPSWANHTYNPDTHKETVFQRAYLQYKEKLNSSGNGNSTG